MPLPTTDYLCRSLFIILGWVAFGLLAYKVSTTKIDNKIYDPFEILGIKSVSLDGLTSICSWLQTLSVQSALCHSVSYITFIRRVLRKRPSSLTTKNSPKYSEFPSLHSSLIALTHYLHSHPDKVKLTGNDTADSVAARFVEITKAYKAYAVIYRNLPDLTWLQAYRRDHSEKFPGLWAPRWPAGDHNGHCASSVDRGGA
jgi:hypothetical protein